MLTQQIGAEANNINQAIDRVKTKRRKRDRQSLLQEALSASLRALEELKNEPLIMNTRAYVAETLERYSSNALAVAEELRLDTAALRWFIKAECGLLLAEGFDCDVVAAIEEDMLEVFNREWRDMPESMEEQFNGLISRIQEDLNTFEVEGERSEMFRHIAVVLGVLGGCAAVAADTATAVGTAGTTAALLAVSVPLGSTMIDSALSDLSE